MDTTCLAVRLMRVLVACEFSGVVRRAFRALGHDAWSCDVLPSEDASQFHYKLDVRELFPGGRLYQTFMLENQAPKWDLMIAHPPCTHLAVSGARWFKDKRKEQEEALEFVRFLMNAPVLRIAIENPVSIISSRIRKPDQIVQPWMFGHPEKKKTCLWLKGLPPLKPTRIVRWKMNRRPVHLANRVHHAAPGPERWKDRSRTLEGIAQAMAEQWF